MQAWARSWRSGRSETTIGIPGTASSSSSTTAIGSPATSATTATSGLSRLAVLPASPNGVVVEVTWKPGCCFGRGGARRGAAGDRLLHRADREDLDVLEGRLGAIPGRVLAAEIDGQQDVEPIAGFYTASAYDELWLG